MGDAHETGARGVAWIADIIEACPRRVAGSEDERRAQQVMADELEQLGAEVELRPFAHNRSLYMNMTVHFALAIVGTALLWAGQALPAALVHMFVAVAYTLDSSKRLRFIRALLPQHTSQNLVATFPARGELRGRLVLVGHADAAYTGAIFHPEAIRRATAEPPLRALRFMRKSMFVATASVALLVALDLIVWRGWAAGWGEWVALALSIPSLLTAALNAQVVLRNEIVPGANDNLTGCFTGIEIARRLADARPDGVELVVVAAGCEEAGTGGSWALAQQMRHAWSPAQTWVLGVDSMSNGEMRYFVEGEVVPTPPPARFEAIVREVLPEVERFEIPSGATDALPFLVRGYPALSLGCVDPEIGAPREYHWPTDDAEHLDADQLGRSVEQVERLTRALFEELSSAGSHAQ